MTRHKDGCNGEEVLGKFCGSSGTTGGIVHRAVVNHDESGASLREDEFHELKREATQSVAVGNHNLRDHTAVDAFQKGTQAFAVEIDAAANVADELIGGIEGAEGFDLAVEIAGGFLLGAADAGVDDAFTLELGGAGGGTAVADVIADAFDVVEAAAGGSSESNDCDLFLFCPLSEGLSGDVVEALDLCGGEVLGGGVVVVARCVYVMRIALLRLHAQPPPASRCAARERCEVARSCAQSGRAVFVSVGENGPNPVYLYTRAPTKLHICVHATFKRYPKVELCS